MTLLAAVRPRLPRIRGNGWTWAVVGLSLAFVALHLWLSREMDAPFIFSDEIGYLLDARFLSGVDPAPHHPFVPLFYAGYPLLLTPLSWIFEQPTDVYHGALFVNALLGGATVAILYAIGREVLGLVPKHALLAAGLAGAYPAFLLNTNIAWAENLLPPLVALHVLFVYRAERRGTFPWLAAPAVTAAWLYTTHPRTLPIVAVTVLWYAWIALRRVTPLTHVAGALGILAVLGLGGVLLNDHVRDAVYRGPVGGRSSFESSGEFVTHSVQSPSGYLGALAKALGQAWYLCATSAGLWALGVGFLAYMVWRGRGLNEADADSQARAHTACFALLAVLASFVPSALIFATTSSNSFYAVYGRYMEAVSPVILLAGAAAVLLLQGRRQRLLAVGAAAGATLLLTLFLIANSPELDRAPISPVVVLAGLFPGGVSSWSDLIGFDVLRATAIGVGAMALFAAVPARWAGLAVIVVAGGFVLSSLVVTERVIQPFAAGLSGKNTLQSTLESLPPGEPISYELASFTDDRMPPYQFAIDDHEFLLFDSRDGERPASEVVVAGIADPHLLGRGARIVVLETFLDQAVYVLPGTLQRRLARQGRLFPGRSEDPLPAAARASRIVVKDPVSKRLRVPSGGSFALRVSVTHTGTGSPWRQPRYIPTLEGRGSVFLAGSWHPGRGRAKRVSTQTVPLPRTMAAGETQGVELSLVAVDRDGRPLRPGRYTVELTPSQEGVGLFSDFGDRPRELPVVVTRPRG